MSLKELRTDADKQSKRTDLDQKIVTLRSELFRKSIDISSMFEEFINLLRFLNNPNFEIPVGAFRRVYPGIFKGLQNEWHNEVKDHSNWLETREQAGIYCDHKWEQLTIIMLPEKYYFCRKCSDLIDEKHMDKILSKQG